MLWAATTTCPSATLKCQPRIHSGSCYSCCQSQFQYFLVDKYHRYCCYAYNSSKFCPRLLGIRIWCCSSNSSSSSSAASSSSAPKPKPKRGFGPQPSTSSNNNKAKKSSTPRIDENPRLRKSSSQQSGSVINQAPGITSRTEGTPKSIVSDLEFEERLQAVRRSALEQKKSGEEKQFGAIDYDAPVEPKSSTIGLGTKIGVGVAVIVFGLVFALGDFLPSGSVSPTEEPATVDKRISEEDKANLQKRLQQFEATLNGSPEDPTALEGAAVTLVELGEYKQAAMLLEDLSKKKPSDPDVFRLLGDVKYELRDYDGSAIAYRNSAKVSKTITFEVLRGLTDALLAAKKPDEAVQFLLASREHLRKEVSAGSSEGTENLAVETRPEVDPIQVDLLLGKAYSDWGHVSDAVSVYDQLISSHPEDFRGYLAKGILLKENGNIGDAERMFIQARFFAPAKAKALVDKYAR